jgi:HlyD family secretion protein
MARTRKSPLLKWLVILIVLGGAGVGGVAYVKRPKEAALEFKSAPIARGEIIQMVTANGQLTPVVNVEVGSQVSGAILKIFVDFNSKVTNGQVIAQIDPETFDANVMQAEAELANTAASLELAQVNARRAQELYKNRLIAQSDYDTTMAGLHQAEAMVKIREASVKKVKTDLERTTIYAPIDGFVISRNIEVGQTVAASFNTPKLFQIANDLSKMEIEAMVSEADVGEVEEGQPVTFTVDAFPTRQFRGAVKQVRYAPTTNQNVVTYTSVVEVNNDDLKLRPGMTANASIITAQRRDALKIPNAALRFRPPDNTILKPPTNAPSSGASSTNALTAGSPSGEPPSPPWVAEGRQPRGMEEVRKWMDSLPPEQREAARQQFRGRTGRGGDGPPGGFGGGGGGRGFRGSRESTSRQEGPVSRTAYVLEKTKTSTGKEIAMARPVTVKVGITDGTTTEVLEGLKEGDVVITGANTSATTPTIAQGPPGSSPFGRSGFRGR